MIDQPGGVRPMEGRGAYNRSSRVQASGLEPAISLFEQAAQTIPLPAGPEPIGLADYGCSEGRNSIPPMTAALSILKARAGEDRAIRILFADLPGNDFSALFQTLDSVSGRSVGGDPQVFPCAVGRSYFEAIAPAGTIALGWSSWAVQWLSRVPARIPDQVQIAYSRDRTAQEAYAAQAAADWRLFLTRRAAELAPGGQLVVLTMATADDGGFGYAPILHALYGALQALVSEGFLAAAELDAMAIPTVGRSRADFIAPFGESDDFDGLTLGHLEIFEGEDHIWGDYMRDRDATAFGAQWARFSRASVFPSLAASLETGGASRSSAFFDRLATLLASRLAEAPVRMKIPLAKMTVTKARR